MSAAFVKSNESNKWDLVVTSITGDVELVNRRISDITFLTDGSFVSVGGAEKAFQFKFAGGDEQTIDLNFGLSQFGGASTVVPGMQDGYAAGWLSSVSVSREGVLVGVFTNGIRRDIAAIKLATFQNPAALTSVGNNYYIGSANSGDPAETKALMGSAGAVVGGSLEKSNVQMASEFVNLIEAQNGFQANARTIKVATDLVRELTGLIR
jgi:flagellar hook protein FlgE